MTRRMFSMLAVLLVSALMTACDDKPAVPQAILDQSKNANQPKVPKIPTTQELLTGPRKRMALVPLPLTMEVPPGWGKLSDNIPPGIKISDVVLNVLQGYTPSGEIQIRLSSRPSIKQEELDRIIDYGKKEMAEKPKQIVKFELRPLGNVKVLERQSVGQPGELTTYDSNNQPHTKIETVFNWSQTVLVPNEGAYQVYELSFVWLTKDQYEKDKEFLHSVLSTLRYANDTTPAAALSPTTLP